jgi:branched-subunit amino acid transport protein
VTEIWATVAALVVLTAAFKAVGPLTVGGRGLPDHLAGVVGLMAPSLLAALVVYETLAAHGRGIEADARLAGLAAAALALWLRAPLIVVVIVAAAATAAARAVG